MGSSARDPNCRARCPQASSQTPIHPARVLPPRVPLFTQQSHSHSNTPCSWRGSRGIPALLSRPAQSRAPTEDRAPNQCIQGPQERHGPKSCRPQILPPLAFLGGQGTKAARNELQGEGSVKAAPASLRFSHFWAKSPVRWATWPASACLP